MENFKNTKLNLFESAKALICTFLTLECEIIKKLLWYLVNISYNKFNLENIVLVSR